MARTARLKSARKSFKMVPGSREMASLNLHLAILVLGFCLKSSIYLVGFSVECNFLLVQETNLKMHVKPELKEDDIRFDFVSCVDINIVEAGLLIKGR